MEGGGIGENYLINNVALIDNPQQRFILRFFESKEIVQFEGEVYIMNELFPSPSNNNEKELESVKPLIKAYTLNELLIIVPSQIPYNDYLSGYFFLEKDKEEYTCGYYRPCKIQLTDKKPANAIGKLCLWLKEKGHIKTEVNYGNKK
jgi:hypothetical protein